MPLIKSAKKKLRQDRKRRILNLKIKKRYREALKEAKKKPVKENIAKAFSALDKAVKKNVISKNKAARIKSKLSHDAKS